MSVERYLVTSDLVVQHEQGMWVRYSDHAAALRAERAKFAAFADEKGEPLIVTERYEKPGTGKIGLVVVAQAAMLQATASERSKS